MQHALAQQIKSGASIPLPFDEFEPVYMAPHSPVVSFHRERGFYRRLVTANTDGTAVELADRTSVCPLQPPRKGITIPRLHHAAPRAGW